MNSRFSFHVLLWSSLLILIGVMGWLSHSMLDAERRRLEETHQIRLVEQSRLALWRMDSLLAAMIAGENNRSPGEYFKGNVLTDSRREEVSVPDLTGFSKLYFQIDPWGNISSPQKDAERLGYVIRLGKSGLGSRVADAMRNVPKTSPLSRQENSAPSPAVTSQAPKSAGVPAVISSSRMEPEMEKKAFFLSRRETPQTELEGENRKALQQGFEDYNMRKNLSNAGNQQEYNISVKVDKSVLNGKTAPCDSITRSGASIADKKKSLGRKNLEKSRITLKMEGGAAEEFLPHQADVMTASGSFRDEGLKQADVWSVQEESLGKMMDGQEGEFIKTPESYRELSISSLQPRWHSDKECFLTRRISDHGRVWVQGIWLDWNKLSGYLLDSVADILPEATLVPDDGREESYLTLAGIPARLDPGGLPGLPGNSMRTVWNSMVMAWSCGILALCGMIGFIIGLLRLSERRAVFVSAVTHELRTPLTTFNMYTEMLSSGLVPKGREIAYVDILKREAGRLTHLVDNVLSYARVEKNSVSLRADRIPVGVLASAVIARISPRLTGAGMDSQLSVSPELQRDAVLADMTAVEQIVYNLADNAAKYARFDGSVLKVELTKEKRFLVIRVEDEGKGISVSLKGKLFRPFSRSAEEAAGKQPGVGLGLALSRELARNMGGDLWLEESSGHGCRFALRLPLCRE